MSKLEPAYSIIRKFDRWDDGKRTPGDVVLAEQLGLTDSAVRKWALAKERGGRGGFVNPKYYGRLLDFAGELGVSLDPSEFVVRSETEAAA